MRLLTTAAAVAAAMTLSLGLTALPASARFAPSNQITAGEDTTFDLGIDVSGVALNARSVDAYVATLAPETRAVIADTCQNYVRNPTDAKSSDTLPFCKIVASGAPAAAAPARAVANVHTFASTGPLVITNQRPQAANAASGHRYNVFPDENDANYGLNGD